MMDRTMVRMTPQRFFLEECRGIPRSQTLLGYFHSEIQRTEIGKTEYFNSVCFRHNIFEQREIVVHISCENSALTLTPLRVWDLIWNNNIYGRD